MMAYVGEETNAPSRTGRLNREELTHGPTANRADDWEELLPARQLTQSSFAQ
jgi:hypothetical protein